LGEKHLVNFGPQTKKVIGAHVDTPNWTFSGDYISAPRGRWPLKFLHVLLAP